MTHLEPDASNVDERSVLYGKSGTLFLATKARCCIGGLLMFDQNPEEENAHSLDGMSISTILPMVASQPKDSCRSIVDLLLAIRW